MRAQRSTSRLTPVVLDRISGGLLRLMWLTFAMGLASGVAVSSDLRGLTNLCVGGTPNGVFQPGEECDTGNSDPFDGCDSNCRIVEGWACENPVAIGPLQIESYPGAGSNWTLSNGGRTARQTVNTPTATFAMVGAPAFDATYTFEAGVVTSADDDFFGFALGFEPGETLFGEATDYLVLSWKQVDQGSARRGLALLHVVGAAPGGINDSSPLWTYGFDPQPPVSVLAWASTSGDAGWSNNVLYDWEIEYRQDRLVVSLDGVEEFNLQASSWPDRFPDGFPDGRLAFYSFNQEQTQFTISGPFEPSSCAIATHQVTPQAGVGGILDPATPQTVAHGETVSFEVEADTGYSVGAVDGCDGTLDEATFTTAPVTGDCTVMASFVPGTGSTLSADPNPVRANQSVTFTVVVTGVGEAPADGEVTVTAAGGGACTDEGPPEVAGLTASFSCAISFASLGPREVQAGFAGSATHTDSSSAPLTLSVLRFADLSVSADDGETMVDPGDAASYLIEVRNAGPDEAPGTRVQVGVAPALLNAEWTCEAVGVASCPEAAGSSPIDQTVSLPADSGLDYVLIGTLPGALPPTVVLLAETEVDPASPSFVFDPQPGNNSAADVNEVQGIFMDGFE